MIKNILILIILAVFSLNTYANNFQLLSVNITSGKEISHAQVFNGLGCHGLNMSPQLSWSNAPTSTKSFVVTMYDPDASSGKGWWHWVLFNIPVNVNHLDENAGNPQSGKLPASALQGKTDFGLNGYNGPCPPIGDKPHRYIVTVYALNNTLPPDAKSSGELADSYIQKYKIASASIIAVYHRESLTQ